MDRGNNPDADGQFVKAPILNVNDDKLKFDTNDVDNANENYGSASFFIPKLLLDENAPPYGGASSYCFVERIHPPSILPISSVCA
jgi:hypothetical protein